MSGYAAIALFFLQICAKKNQLDYFTKKQLFLQRPLSEIYQPAYTSNIRGLMKDCWEQHKRCLGVACGSEPRLRTTALKQCNGSGRTLELNNLLVQPEVKKNIKSYRDCYCCCNQVHVVYHRRVDIPKAHVCDSVVSAKIKRIFF